MERSVALERYDNFLWGSEGGDNVDFHDGGGCSSVLACGLGEWARRRAAAAVKAVARAVDVRQWGRSCPS